MISSSRMSTLDEFVQRPLTRRTEKFMSLCEFFRAKTGEYPLSGYQIFDFIHEQTLPFELRHFKLLSEEKILSVFWKWQRIMGIARETA
jgi:hypothetical protein